MEIDFLGTCCFEFELARVVSFFFYLLFFSFCFFGFFFLPEMQMRRTIKREIQMWRLL